jgi:hypothetical protein
MDDKTTAAKIISGLQAAHRLTAKNRKLWNIEGKQRFIDRRCVTRQIHEMESAIVAALEAARREGYEKGRAVGVPWIGKPVEDAAMEGGKA